MRGFNIVASLLLITILLTLSAQLSSANYLSARSGHKILLVSMNLYISRLVLDTKDTYIDRSREDCLKLQVRDEGECNMLEKKSNQFMLNGSVFYVNGFNTYWLMVFAVVTSTNPKFRISIAGSLCWTHSKPNMGFQRWWMESPAKIPWCL